MRRSCGGGARQKNVEPEDVRTWEGIHLERPSLVFDGGANAAVGLGKSGGAGGYHRFKLCDKCVASVDDGAKALTGQFGQDISCGLCEQKSVESGSVEPFG